MTHSPNSNPPRANGRDPQLGGSRRLIGDLGAIRPSDFTGLEPLLGGIRRAGPDMARIQALLEARSDEERADLIDHITRLGQTSVYVAELVQVIPERARQKTGSWRGSFSPAQRVAAMQALALIGGADSIGPLLVALGDSTYQVRCAAEKALIAVSARLDPAIPRTREIIRGMVDGLRTLPQNARKVVAHILASAPPDLVLGPLLTRGLTADEWWARRESAWVLGTLGDIRATRRLIDALEGDPSEAVRSSAAWALGRLDAPIARAPLAKAAQDRDEVVRSAAVEALGAHAARMSSLDPDFRPTLGDLVKALEDEDWAVRHTAIDTLLELDSPQARQVLQAIMDR